MSKKISIENAKYLVFILLIFSSFQIKERDVPVLKMSVAKYDKIGSDNDTCFSCGDCSIYCLIENQYSLNSSSFLVKQGNNEYQPSKLDDYNLQTAWFEGVEGD